MRTGLLVFFAFLSLQPLAAADKVVSRESNAATFRQTYDVVWSAVVELVSTYNLTPKTIDKGSGSIFLESGTAWGSTWGSANNAIRLLTTKKVGAMSTWQAIAVKANVFVKGVSDDQTRVQVNLEYYGCNGFSGWAASMSSNTCRWEALSSNSTYESQILNSIAERLPEFQQPQSKPTAEALAQSQELLNAVQKVVATVELGASTDQIISSLVSARVGQQNFADSEAAKSLPKFLNAVDTAILNLKGTISQPPQDDALKNAKKAITDAKAFLNLYRTNGEESVVLTPLAERASSEKVILGFDLWNRTDRPGVEGTRLRHVLRGSDADKAGLRPEDVLIFINGLLVSNESDIKEQLGKRKAGDAVKFTILRSGQPLDLDVTITEGL